MSQEHSVPLHYMMFPSLPLAVLSKNKNAFSRPTEMPCRGQMRLAFCLLQRDIDPELKSILSLNILPISMSAVTKHFFFLSLLVQTIDKIIWQKLFGTHVILTRN